MSYGGVLSAFVYPAKAHGGFCTDVKAWRAKLAPGIYSYSSGARSVASRALFTVT
jgi:hypothetical protein